MYRKHKKDMESNTTTTSTPGSGLKTIDKIVEIPVVDSALNKVTDMYGQIKDRNTLLRTGCNLAEMSLRTIKFASTPITTLMQGPSQSCFKYVDFLSFKKFSFILKYFFLISKSNKSIHIFLGKLRLSRLIIHQLHSQLNK